MEALNQNPPQTHAHEQRGRSRQRQRQRRALNRNNLRSREGFFMHYLFVTLSVRYANYFRPTVRRLIEFFTLIKAILMLLFLIYIHMTFVNDSGDCLEQIEKIWPRTGVIRVQVDTNTSLPPYQLYFVKRNTEEWTASYSATPYEAVFKYSLPLDGKGMVRDSVVEDNSRTVYDKIHRAKQLFGLIDDKQCPIPNLDSSVEKNSRRYLREIYEKVMAQIDVAPSEQEVPHWIADDPSISDRVMEMKMSKMHDMSGLSVGPQSVREYYAIEYSTEFGFLRLSAITRHKLSIPVLVVTLDPSRDACFGQGMKRWMLETFFGYDDLIMSSIKKLAERGNSSQGGYLRNLITGEHFKFITLWVSHTSYLLAFVVMLVFTLVVTMLLRYSYHQIFTFMVELLHMLDTDTTLVFPAAPMLTIILALVGTEEIMTEFFNDSTLAFYVILSIWTADQFDAICMHTVVSRRYWVRFFFLYHFAFYAYHYRFNGQFSEIALFTSWLFIQHSMFYFFHHYELPAIQHQMRLRQVIFQTNVHSSPPPPPPPTSNNEDNRDDVTPAETEHDNTSQSNGAPSTSVDDNRTHYHDDNPEQSSGSNIAEENQQSADHRICRITFKKAIKTSVVSEGLKSSETEIQDNLLASSGGFDSLISPPSVTHDFSTEFAQVHDFPSKVNMEGKIADTFIVWDEEEYQGVFADEIRVPALLERDFRQGDIGIMKYCNLFVLLFVALIAIVLMFSFVIMFLNQVGSLGRINPRLGPGFDNVANLIR